MPTSVDRRLAALTALSASATTTGGQTGARSGPRATRRTAAASTRQVDIDKSGFERSVALAAQTNGLAYGLAAVALALLLGWGAGEAFRRYG